MAKPTLFHFSLGGSEIELHPSAELRLGGTGCDEHTPPASPRASEQGCEEEVPTDIAFTNLQTTDSPPAPSAGSGHCYAVGTCATLTMAAIGTLSEWLPAHLPCSHPLEGPAKGQGCSGGSHYGWPISHEATGPTQSPLPSPTISSLIIADKNLVLGRILLLQPQHVGQLRRRLDHQPPHFVIRDPAVAWLAQHR
jgi:hypothetical protein